MHVNVDEVTSTLKFQWITNDLLFHFIIIIIVIIIKTSRADKRMCQGRPHMRLEVNLGGPSYLQRTLKKQKVQAKYLGVFANPIANG